MVYLLENFIIGMQVKNIIERGLRVGYADCDIPFGAIGSQKPNSFRDRRFRFTLNFIDNVGFKVLDIGSRSAFTDVLEKRFDVRIDNTLSCDFNVDLKSPQMKYDTIFCFEVLEHVMNPFDFMCRIREKLQGDLYLSTPLIGLTGILQTDAHFTEYKKTRLEILFEYAGFEIVSSQVFNSVSLLKAFTGIRPMFQRLFKDNIIFKLR